MKTIKTLTTNQIQELITRGVQDFISQGYIITGGFTSCNLPRFDLEKDGEVIHYGGRSSGIKGVVIELNNEVIHEFFEIDYKGQKTIYVTNEDDLEKVKELQRQRADLRWTESKKFTGKKTARAVRKVPGFKTVPSYLISVSHVSAGYRVTNTRTHKSTIVEFVK